MNLPIAQEASIFQSRNQPQHARLFAKLQVVLKTDQIIAVGAQVFFAQLHNGPGSFAGAGIAQADGLHRAKAQGVAAAASQNLNRQAAFEIIGFFPLFALGGLSGKQRIQEAVELRAVHGAVDVVGGSLVPARGHIDAVHVDGVGLNYGRDRVVEGQAAGACDALNLSAQGIGGQRAGGENCTLRAVLVLVQSGDFLANDANARLGGDRLGNPPRKLDAIHGQGVAGGDCGFIGNAQQRGTRTAHLLLEQPRRGVGRFALQGIGTDQLAKLGRLVSRGQALLAIHDSSHLVEVHVAAQPRRSQCRFRPGQSAADDANSHCAVFPAKCFSASPVTRTVFHSSRNSAPIAR